MSKLLNKESHRYKIHTLVMERSVCPPAFFRQPPIWLTPYFYKKNLSQPYPSMIFQKSQPSTYKEGVSLSYEYAVYLPQSISYIKDTVRSFSMFH